MGLCASRKPGEGVAAAMPPVDQTQIDKGRTPVYLHIYDLLVMNYNAESIGLGVYHTGVQVYEDEYCFSGHNQVDAESGQEITGLRCFRPPTDTSWIEDAVYKESVIVGYSDMSEEEVEDLFEEMKGEFVGASYNVLARNCNHFSARFIERLLRMPDGTAELLIPTYVSRVVRAAQKVRPCLPSLLTTDLRAQMAPTVVGRGSRGQGMSQPQPNGNYGIWSGAGSVSEGGQSASGSQTAREFRQPLVGAKAGSGAGGGGAGGAGGRSRREAAAEERKRVQAKLLKQQQALAHSLARLQKQHNGATGGAASSPSNQNNGSSTSRAPARAHSPAGAESSGESQSSSSSTDDDGAESDGDATAEGDQVLPSPPKAKANAKATSNGAATARAPKSHHAPSSSSSSSSKRPTASGSMTSRPVMRASPEDEEEDSSLGSYVPYTGVTSRLASRRGSWDRADPSGGAGTGAGAFASGAPYAAYLAGGDGSETARARRPRSPSGNGSQTARPSAAAEAAQRRREEEVRKARLLEQERSKYWVAPAAPRTAAQIAADRFSVVPRDGQMSAAALAVSQLTRASMSQRQSLAAGSGAGAAGGSAQISPALLAATAAASAGGGGSRRVSVSQAAPALPPERQSNSRRGSLSGLPGGLPLAQQSQQQQQPPSGSLSHRGSLSVAAASGSAAGKQAYPMSAAAASGSLTSRGGGGGSSYPIRTASGVPLVQSASGSQTARARF